MAGNSKILKETGAIATEIKKYYVSNDLKGIETVLNEYLNKIVELDKIPKCYTPEQLELTHSLGNSKIGEDTLCISFNTGLLCVMSLTGNCANCGICYAVAQNKMYFKNTVPKNTINQLILTKIFLNKVSLHQVLQNTVYGIFCKYTASEIKNIKFLRINVEGDILNNEYLVLINQIAGCLQSVFNLISCYSYTHNKELDLFLADNINFNTSDFYNACTNDCRTIDSVTADMRKDIINRLVVLCNGDCNKCSYCKDKNNTKTILFLKHGGQYKGIEAIKETDTELFKIITEYKKEDHNYFIIKETAETF